MATKPTKPQESERCDYQFVAWFDDPIHRCTSYKELQNRTFADELFELWLPPNLSRSLTVRTGVGACKIDQLRLATDLWRAIKRINEQRAASAKGDEVESAKEAGREASAA